jgi:hypothetical protein
MLAIFLPLQKQHERLMDRAPGSENTTLRYMRVFRKRKNEGFMGHNDLFLAKKVAKNGVCSY